MRVGSINVLDHQVNLFQIALTKGHIKVLLHRVSRILELHDAHDCLFSNNRSIDSFYFLSSFNTISGDTIPENDEDKFLWQVFDLMLLFYENVIKVVKLSD